MTAREPARIGAVQRPAARVLLAHAHTGSRDSVDPLHEFRRLSPLGWEQARRLVGDLAGFDVHCVLSSPSLRCRQTVMPLAAARSLDIEPMPDLSRSSPVGNLLTLLRSEWTRGAVLCTHPELIAELLPHLGVGLERLAETAGTLAQVPADATVWLVRDFSDEEEWTTRSADRQRTRARGVSSGPSRTANAI